MSFFLRPAILTNHAIMLALYLTICLTYLLVLSFGPPSYAENTNEIFEFLIVLVPMFWIITVAMQLQNWKNRREYQLVWGLAIVFLLSLSVIPTFDDPEPGNEASQSIFRLLIVSAVGVHLSLSWQIASHLAKGVASKLLYTLLVSNWPFFLFVFSNRLRTALKSYAALSDTAG